MLAQHPADELAVADLADHQRGVEHRLPEAGDETVEHHDLLAALAQLQDDVAADVTGAAGDEDRGLGHAGFRMSVRVRESGMIANRPSRGLTGPTLCGSAHP